MMRLIIHVGPHKTGTTSLQVRLAEQFGSPGGLIWYPSPMNGGPGHSDIARNTLGGCLNHPNLRSVLAEATANGVDWLILSSEDFSNLRSVRPEIFSDLTELTDVHLVVTLTSFARRYYSMWFELLKAGDCRSLNEAASHIFDMPGFYFDYLQRMRRSIPQGDMHVFAIDRSDQLNLFEQFYGLLSSLVGTEIAYSSQDLKRINASGSPAVANTLLIANRLLSDGGLTSRDRLDFVQKLALALDEQKLLKAFEIELSDNVREHLDICLHYYRVAVDELKCDGRFYFYGHWDSL